VQDVEFVNFRGDDNFAHYLRIAVAFGIPWAMIADGKSYTPKSGSGGSYIPLVAQQIKDVCNEFGDSIDLAQPSAEGSDPKGGYGWFQFWKQALEQYGVFSLANCWKTKVKERVNCPRDDCNWTRLETSESCDHPGWHTAMSHTESFEEFCDNESEFSDLRNLDWWSSRNKVSRALELVDAYPTCPIRVANIFDCLSGCWK
jgi:hypothetical protein